MAQLLENIYKFPWRLMYGSIYCKYIKQYGKGNIDKSKLKALYGEPEEVRALLKNISGSTNLDTSTDTENPPIFILATGWRTGSTLLQRLLMSSGEALIWGEPYSDTLPSIALLSHLRAFKPGYPFNGCFQEISTKNIKEVSRSWAAYLFPPFDCLYEAHKSFLLQLLREPASVRGFHYWGMKEIRLDICQAFYLNWLFPNSKFIFLTRNPLDSYRSYKGFRWYIKYPDLVVGNVTDFAWLWTYLAEGFLNYAPQLNSIVVRYEDLIGQPSEISRIEDFVGLKIDRSLLKVKVSGQDSNTDKSLEWHEKLWLRKITSMVAQQFNYIL